MRQTRIASKNSDSLNFVELVRLQSCHICTGPITGTPSLALHDFYFLMPLTLSTQSTLEWFILVLFLFGWSVILLAFLWLCFWLISRNWLGQIHCVHLLSRTILGYVLIVWASAKMGSWGCRSKSLRLEQLSNLQDRLRLTLLFTVISAPILILIVTVEHANVVDKQLFHGAGGTGLSIKPHLPNEEEEEIDLRMQTPCKPSTTAQAWTSWKL